MTWPLIVNAQDAHYWTEQYGNKSMLLSGTVNASVQDLGLVFYNPGRLAQIDNPAFVISAKVYELSKIRIKDGLNEGADLKKSSFGGAPNLVAGTFKLPFLTNHHFAYSFLTRSRYNTDLSTRVSLDEQEDKGTPYNYISAKVRSNNQVNEEWYGLTWSYRLNKVLAIGLSTFATQTRNSGALELQLQGMRTDSLVSMATFHRQLGYNKYGFLWKAGLSAAFEKINLGLTITTPKINLFGDGSTIYEDFVSNVDSINSEPVGDKYIENYQDDLEVKLKSPWAIGLGIAIKLPHSTVHLSSEWYSSINKYTVMEADQIVGQVPNDSIDFILTEDLRSVLNFGLGYEHRFSEKIEIFVSAATDFTAINEGSTYIYEFDQTEYSNSTFDGDIFHFGGGVALDLTWAELTLGATYGNAQRSVPKPLDISGDQIVNPDETTSLFYSRWRFIVGFSFPFANKLTEKLDGSD